MTQLGPVGIALSVVFAIFMTVLFVELWYVWWSRRRRTPSREVSGARPATLRKQELLVLCRWTPKARSVRASGEGLQGEARRSWAKRVAMWCGGPPAAASKLLLRPCSDLAMEEGARQMQQTEADPSASAAEAEAEEDVLSLDGLWGPPRFLFTITEETMEEMEVEEARCNGGRCLAHELEPSPSASSIASPFLTPPSSPPFATPFGSPAVVLTPAADLPRPPSLPLPEAEAESLSASSTSSSSPVLLDGRRRHPPLSVLFEDSSSSSTSSSATTPAALSPTSASPLPLCSSPTKRGQRPPLSLFLREPAYSPRSALIYNHHTNRVYPLLTPQPNGPFNAEDEPPLPLHGVDELSRPFCLPPLLQPTTPCPFRPSLVAKAGSRGAACSPVVSPHARFSPSR